MNYEQYIARCIEIARRGEYYVAPNPMVGAVLVAPSDSPMEGEGILAEGWHERFGEGHAEVNCFRSLETSKYRDIDLSKCTFHEKSLFKDLNGFPFSVAHISISVSVLRI